MLPSDRAADIWLVGSCMARGGGWSCWKYILRQRSCHDLQPTDEKPEESCNLHSSWAGSSTFHHDPLYIIEPLGHCWLYMVCIGQSISLLLVFVYYTELHVRSWYWFVSFSCWWISIRLVSQISGQAAYVQSLYASLVVTYFPMTRAAVLNPTQNPGRSWGHGFISEVRHKSMIIH